MDKRTKEYKDLVKKVALEQGRVMDKTIYESDFMQGFIKSLDLLVSKQDKEQDN